MNSNTSAAQAPLEAVLITEDLKRRPSREPDYKAENDAFEALAQGLADSPDGILHCLAEVALDLCEADSAGISLLVEKDGEQFFHWPAVAGQWKGHVGGGMPRHSPCGLVLEREAPQLFARPERHYQYGMPVKFGIAEALLSPFHVDGKAVGTLWVLVHDDTRKFDSEDLRRLTSLATFAAAAFRTARLLEETLKALEERKQMEQALRHKAAELAEVNRRKDEFLAVLAHELRNPMAPLSNSLHILRLTSPGAPETRTVGEMIERQVDHLRRLVDDLTEASRITQGRIRLRKEHVDLHRAVRNAVETSRPVIESARHRLTVSLPDEPVLVADPVRLTQIIANLLNNAAKYTPAGGQIRLGVECCGDEVAISVSDNGIGIPPAMLTRVFDMFTQVDQSAARAQGGLGIGLTLVRHLVELHGGCVEARSAGLNQGTEFVVRLPRAARAEAGEQCALENPRSVDTLPRTRVLVADDNRDAADSLGTLLQLLGAESRVVYSGPEALDALDEYRPQVVILDIGMPGMDGLEVARRIRQHPQHRGLKLVALTGWGQEDDRRQSHAAGFDFHLVKPLDVGALQSLLCSLDGN